jgi:hypothetical protein
MQGMARNTVWNSVFFVIFIEMKYEIIEKK